MHFGLFPNIIVAIPSDYTGADIYVGKLVVGHRCHRALVEHCHCLAYSNHHDMGGKKGKG